MPIALLSVSDKTDLVLFGKELDSRGWTILSTGGTAQALREAGVSVSEVSEFTGHPEIMEGRVKTLHPAVHAGLLGRRGNAGDEKAMADFGYLTIDLVAVNLYPFRETVGRVGTKDAEAIEQIDIGGPAMLRSAAKNHESVWVIVEPGDYGRVVAALDDDECDHLPLRRELATRVFEHTAAYDGAISAYLGRSFDAQTDAAEEPLPGRIALGLERVQALRYGENPGQRAALYRDSSGARGLPDMRQLHGKELSFNNLLDVEGALLAISAWHEEDGPAACAVIKHTTPCGLASARTAADAYQKAHSTDPISAFGSVVAFNRVVSEDAARLLRPNFVEAVVAPGFDEAALSILREKKNLRLLEIAPTDQYAQLDYKRVRGGFLVQDPLPRATSDSSWEVASKREPTPTEWQDLRFAWRAVASVKSNAIVLARDGMTLGIGAGQMSRVDSSRIAVMKAADNGMDLSGAVLASDAFFPFRDGVDAAAAAGIRAIIQPGGSIRDEEVRQAADEHGIAMVFTGQRLFRH